MALLANSCIRGRHFEIISSSIWALEPSLILKKFHHLRSIHSPQVSLQHPDTVDVHIRNIAAGGRVDFFRGRLCGRYFSIPRNLWVFDCVYRRCGAIVCRSTSGNREIQRIARTCRNRITFHDEICTLWPRRIPWLPQRVVCTWFTSCWLFLLVEIGFWFFFSRFWLYRIASSCSRTFDAHLLIYFYASVSLWCMILLQLHVVSAILHNFGIFCFYFFKKIMKLVSSTYHFFSLTFGIFHSSSVCWGLRLCTNGHVPKWSGHTVAISIADMLHRWKCGQSIQHNEQVDVQHFLVLVASRAPAILTGYVDDCPAAGLFWEHRIAELFPWVI